MPRKVAAEFIGTFWLVFGGCGAAVLAAAYPSLGIGFAGVAFAFGLTVLTMVYAVGHISGGHFNPAVTIGVWASGRLPASDILPYWIAQVLGAIAAAAVLYVIAAGHPGFTAGGFASNGYGMLSPGHYGLMACAVCEVVMTFFFLTVILGATSPRAPAGFAGLAIGLSLTLIHLVSIPVTNTSVNPARSLGPALFAGAPWIDQLWLFWLAPIAGALIAGWVARLLQVKPELELQATPAITLAAAGGKS
jgi:aquaporin Z